MNNYTIFILHKISVSVSSWIKSSYTDKILMYYGWHVQPLRNKMYVYVVVIVNVLFFLFPNQLTFFLSFVFPSLFLSFFFSLLSDWLCLLHAWLRLNVLVAHTLDKIATDTKKLFLSSPSTDSRQIHTAADILSLRQLSQSSQRRWSVLLINEKHIY